MNSAIITLDFINELQKQPLDSAERIAMNTVVENGILHSAYNSAIARQVPKAFSKEIKTSGITDQKRSGRCWIFAALNGLRYDATKKLKIDEFTFSQNYIYFWDKLEKSNSFMERVIHYATKPLTNRYNDELLSDDPQDDGGWPEWAANLINKYGLVPTDIMPETAASNSSDDLNNTLNRLLRRSVMPLRAAATSDVNQARQLKQTFLSDVYRLLVISLGQPPLKFTWQYQDKKKNLQCIDNITPLEFKKKYTRPLHYVTLRNDPAAQANQLYRRSGYSHGGMFGKDLTWLNVPYRAIRAVTRQQIEADKPVLFSCNVRAQASWKKGYLHPQAFDVAELIGVDLSLSKKERSLVGESLSNHEMIITGVDIKDDQPTWWKVENSWGSDNPTKGYFAMSDEWFEAYGGSIAIPKRDLPDDIKQLFKQKPISLKPWENAR